MILTDVPAPLGPPVLFPNLDPILSWAAWGCTLICLPGLLLGIGAATIAYHRGDVAGASRYGALIAVCLIGSTLGLVSSLVVGTGGASSDPGPSIDVHAVGTFLHGFLRGLGIMALVLFAGWLVWVTVARVHGRAVRAREAARALAAQARVEALGEAVAARWTPETVKVMTVGLAPAFAQAVGVIGADLHEVCQRAEHGPLDAVTEHDLRSVAEQVVEVCQKLRELPEDLRTTPRGALRTAPYTDAVASLEVLHLAVRRVRVEVFGGIGEDLAVQRRQIEATWRTSDLDLADTSSVDLTKRIAGVRGALGRLGEVARKNSSRP